MDLLRVAQQQPAHVHVRRKRGKIVGINGQVIVIENIARKVAGVDSVNKE